MNSSADAVQFDAANASPEAIVETIRSDGIALVAGLIAPAQLAAMQCAFRARLARMNWNTFAGYEKTERYRHMVHDVLALEQGFVDLALHPLICEVARRYVGPGFQLTEAKGWRSLRTRTEFHGWHADAWYDERSERDIPPEVKLGLYLTDVASGAFCYLKGSHRRQAPSRVQHGDYKHLADGDYVEVTGAAGTGILFDTSGAHRQAQPVLEEREAIFYNYHDPAVPKQSVDLRLYRYHPLLLNAAFLGGLDAEAQRVLGFGDQRNLQPAYVRPPRYLVVQAINRALFEIDLAGRTALAWLNQKRLGLKRRLARGNRA
jgi:hypothetical protein